MDIKKKLSVTNNASSITVASIDATTTEISIHSTDAHLFPQLDDTLWCPLTISDGQGNMEIVHATNRNGGVFTVIRGQEGTTPLSFPIGARVDLRLTAKAVENIANNEIGYERLPKYRREKVIFSSFNDADSIEITGHYQTDKDTQNIPYGTSGTLIHSELDNGDATQLWIIVRSNLVYVRSRLGNIWIGWEEVTFDRELLSPWAMQLIGVPIPIMSNLSQKTTPPIYSLVCRYIKLTAFSSYNSMGGDGSRDLIISQVVEGTDPNIKATGIINFPDSPLNGKTIRLINTERLFLRAGRSGTIEDSQNLEHAHEAIIADDAADDRHYQTTAIEENRNGLSTASNLKPETANKAVASPSALQKQKIKTLPSGGNESRPRNISVEYYMRIW